MSNFEENLDASISEAQEQGWLSDELYKKYVQYVGALDALPQEAIAVDRLGTDIHDQFGRIKPFSQWPTKSSRSKSEQVWLTYNQRLQIAQAAKEGGTAPEDPTDNPDFLGQLLDTCVRTSMSMGGLDKKTAFRHCSRQVQRFEQAVRGALTDRGLPKKDVEEFTKELLKGMANGKQINMKDLSVEDRQFIQDLADSLTYKPKSESVVKEDIDDVDEFEPCEYKDCVSKSAINPKFHDAHVAAAAFADAEYFKNRNYHAFTQNFEVMMKKYGFVKSPDGSWTDMTFKEDVDVRGFRMCMCGSQNLTPLDDYPYGHPGTAVKCEDCSEVMYAR